MLFPLSPPSKHLRFSIINDFIEETAFENLEKYGCAVCGMLKSVNKLLSLDDIDQQLFSCLEVPGTTRQERTNKRDPVNNVPGPVIDKSCKHVCNKCHSSLKQGKMPQLALANGL